MAYKPKPFSRPSVSLGTGARSEQRVWKDVPVLSIGPGDLVPGIGLIASFEHKGDMVILTGGNDNLQAYQDTDVVHAFVLST